MKRIEPQENLYDEIYRGDSVKYDINLPDYKISDGKKLINKKILVLGVGTARDVRYLADINEIWGVDVSTRGLNIAKKYISKTKKIDLNIGLYGLPSDFFDVIVAKEILEHIDDPFSLMKEVGRCLKRSGYVILDVPNHFYLPMRLRMLFGKNIIWRSLGHNHTAIFEEWDYMHKRFFTWKGFQKFIEKSGFKINKAYWDLGTLGHYNEPEVVLAYMRMKKMNKTLISVLSLGWRCIDMLFPKNLRSHITKLNPALFSACFYVRLKKR